MTNDKKITILTKAQSALNEVCNRTCSLSCNDGCIIKQALHECAARINGLKSQDGD